MNIYYRNYSQMGLIRRDSVGESYSCSIPDMLHYCVLLYHRVNSKDRKKEKKLPPPRRMNIGSRGFCHVQYANKDVCLSLLYSSAAILYCSSK